AVALKTAKRVRAGLAQIDALIEAERARAVRLQGNENEVVGRVIARRLEYIPAIGLRMREVDQTTVDGGLIRSVRAGASSPGGLVFGFKFLCHNDIFPGEGDL